MVVRYNNFAKTGNEMHDYLKVLVSNVAGLEGCFIPWIWDLTLSTVSEDSTSR
jgi:hypothetical protein